MSTVTQAKAAAAFAAYWQGRGYEKGESQIFWTTLLNEVFGIEHPAEFITFEQQVHLDHTSFIDTFEDHGYKNWMKYVVSALL